MPSGKPPSLSEWNLHIDGPDKALWNGLCIVADSRTKHDAQLAEHGGYGHPVLRDFGFGKSALGATAWKRTMRIALYNYGEDTAAISPLQKAAIDAKPAAREKQALKKRSIYTNRELKRHELVAFLDSVRPKCVLVVQNPSKSNKDNDAGTAKNTHATACWTAFNPPDGIEDMAGTFWNTGSYTVVPTQHPLSVEFGPRACTERHYRGALAFATGAREVLTPPVNSSDANGSVQLLSALLDSVNEDGTALAVDIESYSPQNLMTAVGLSDGRISVSVPWDAFAPFGQTYVEPGVTSQQRSLVEAILHSTCPKLFHNYIYDIPFLASKGVTVHGRIHDTMIMHGVVYRQWRHGLQKACASELIIPPWKSLWRPKYAGLKKGDAELYILDPVALRYYNMQDTFYTWHLGNQLKCKINSDLY